MKLPRSPHRWTLAPKEAVRLQKSLAERIEERPLEVPVRLVCGLDAAYLRNPPLALAAAAVWDTRRQEVIESRVARMRLRFPYVPGLLSFREIPALLAVLRRLRLRPDVLLCDAHGRAHPRRFGLASHLGVVTDLPSVGCAKTRLVGSHEQPDLPRGSTAPLIDRGEIVGMAVRTRPGTRPLYVSVGHRVDLAGAVEVVLACSPRFRIPEPIRAADALVRRAAALLRDRQPQAGRKRGG